MMHPTPLTEEYPVAAALQLLEEQTGIVVPVYFRPETDPGIALPILHETVHLLARQLQSGQAICLSVDGPGPGEIVAHQIATHFGTQVVVAPRNRGKLSAVRDGMALLLNNPRLRYFATVDGDGDNFANELLNFVRMAEHVTGATGVEQTLVLGSRLSRHRPLGFLRAEQEELANRMILDAMAYDAAHAGKPLRLPFLTAHEWLPDFNAGYKCFSRRAAEAVFATAPMMASCDETAYYRHACEVVMVVEAHKAGGLLAAVSRRTFDEQPISSYASLNRMRMAADMILWPCKRLSVPGTFVAQWLDNHLPALLLGSLAPQGRDELLAIRDLVLAGYGLPAGAAEIVRPRFI
jgi:hypothetical protein